MAQGYICVDTYGKTLHHHNHTHTVRKVKNATFERLQATRDLDLAISNRNDAERKFDDLKSTIQRYFLIFITSSVSLGEKELLILVLVLVG